MSRSSWGIRQDYERQRLVPPSERCDRCEGTGNELFSMYRRCSACGGTGRFADAPAEQLGEGR